MLLYEEVLQMFGKRKLGFFVFIGVIILLLFLFSASRSRKQDIYNGTFLRGDEQVGNLCEARKKSRVGESGICFA